MKTGMVFIYPKADGDGQNFQVALETRLYTGDLKSSEQWQKQAAIEATKQTAREHLAAVIESLRAFLELSEDAQVGRIFGKSETKGRTDGQEIHECLAFICFGVPSLDHCSIIAGGVTATLTSMNYKRVSTVFLTNEREVKKD